MFDHDGGKRPTKYQKVRSSMFNKNPIFDRMDVHMMSEYDGSEMSYGHRSVMTKRPTYGAQEFQTLVPNANGNNMASQPQIPVDDFETQSVRTLNVRSLSNKKLRPIVYSKAELGKSLDRTNKQASLKA